MQRRTYTCDGCGTASHSHRVKLTGRQENNGKGPMWYTATVAYWRTTTSTRPDGAEVTKHDHIETEWDACSLKCLALVVHTHVDKLCVPENERFSIDTSSGPLPAD